LFDSISKDIDARNQPAAKHVAGCHAWYSLNPQSTVLGQRQQQVKHGVAMEDAIASMVSTDHSGGLILLQTGYKRATKPVKAIQTSYITWKLQAVECCVGSLPAEGTHI
jgi:hypothetical protein